MARTGRHDDHQTRTSRRRRTRLPEASRPIQGTTAGPHAAPPSRRRGRKYGARSAGAAVAGYKPAEHVAQDEETAAAADADTDRHAAGPGPHELVLLHGQPGSPDDWQQVAARLPARLHTVAPDRPGYGSSRLLAGGFAANARAVLDDLDSRGIKRAVLVGHSYGGGVALSAASMAPSRVEAVILLASVGPGCVNGWDRLLAAPGAGQLCALVAWRLTPWIARARLAWLGGTLRPDEHVNWQVWGHAGRGHGTLWRTFLVEQRALLRELGELERAIGSVQAPVLLLADPRDTLVPIDTARRLARALPDARLQLVHGAGHHLPRRAPDSVADAIAAFLAATEEPARRSQARRLTSAAGTLPPEPDPCRRGT